MKKAVVSFGYVVLVLFARETRAQGRASPPPDRATRSITVVPGPRYDIPRAARWLAGEHWRELWQLPLTVPVLRIDTFAGGLAPQRQGGNKQSTTLHFVDAAGTGWVFRSVDKYPDEKLSPDVNGTPLGEVIRDQISAVHPLGGLMVPPLNRALGILHVEPALYVMPDDPALGEFRATFAGMLGTLELKPNEGPEDSPGFAGSRKLKDTEDLFDDLEDSALHTLDERELLRVRLVDFIINDTDRSTDQYRFARFPHATQPSRYLWRPLPRDRDWAFLNADGGVSVLARATAFPKFVAFERRHAAVQAHVFTGHVVDRRLLTSVNRALVAEEVARVQAALTDDVLRAAVDRLPPSYPEEHRRDLVDVMRARRDALAGIANDFYDWLATDVDVRATDEPTRADITRHADGSVEVRLVATVQAEAVSDGDGRDGSAAEIEHYHRVFLPDETSEVRVFLQGGDDRAVVRGSGGGITVRVIGGGGDDVLADSSNSAGVHFYDHRGDNRFLRGTHTHVSTKAWDPPPPPEGLRVGLAWAPDWADRNYWRVAPDYTDAGGIILGLGRTWTTYGFRRLPHHWSVSATALYGLEPGEPGIELEADYNFENSKDWWYGRARWSRFDGFRWYGPGNSSPSARSSDVLVRMQRFAFEPSYMLRFGETPTPLDPTVNASDSAQARQTPHGRLSVGPVLRYTNADTGPATVFGAQLPIGAEPLWQLGAAVRFSAARTDGRAVPRRGVAVRASAAAFPGLIEDDGASARGQAEANVFLPLAGDGLHLAVRAGSAFAVGDYPAFDAAMIGGRTTLRGFSHQRFAGDAAAYGGAELRMPVGRVQLLVNGELGIFGLADAGRVWYDGASPGGWHTGVGGGVWFDSLGRAASLSLASGERVRLYFTFSQPF